MLFCLATSSVQCDVAVVKWVSCSAELCEKGASLAIVPSTDSNN